VGVVFLKHGQNGVDTERRRTVVERQRYHRL
jgi:hypothetical protein